MAEQVRYAVIGDATEEAETAAKINMLADDIGKWAKSKGFWDMPEPLQAMCAADTTVNNFVTTLRKSQKGYLMNSELGEHCESLRGGTTSKLIELGINNETEELADTIIRILDYCGQYELPIGEAIMAKMAVNQKRPFQHGRKF